MEHFFCETSWENSRKTCSAIPNGNLGETLTVINKEISEEDSREIPAEFFGKISGEIHGKISGEIHGKISERIPGEFTLNVRGRIFGEIP